MTITLYAQPYDISATGFYFTDYTDYCVKRDKLKNHYGESVEEFELQFIDGERIDGELFKAIGVNQANIKAFFETALNWDEWEKILVIIATGEAGYSFDIESDCPDHFGVDIYYVDSMKALAEEFVEEGFYGDIPESLQYYIDYDAIADDLAMEYGETTVDGQNIIYRCS